MKKFNGEKGLKGKNRHRLHDEHNEESDVLSVAENFIPLTLVG